MRKYTRSAIFEEASFIRDTILSANDGIITTFAVVAGAQGANLGHNVIILLGIANLIADAISMSSGNFLGVESESEIIKQKTKFKINLSPIKSSLLTFGAFSVAGIIPLIPYVFFENGPSTFISSLILVFIALIILGFFGLYKNCFFVLFLRVLFAFFVLFFIKYNDILFYAYIY